MSGRDASKNNPVWLFLAKAANELACEQGKITAKTVAFGVAPPDRLPAIRRAGKLRK